MSASYWMLVADELLDSETEWEGAGLHLIERGGVNFPGQRWCKFLDDNAPPELEGKEIEPVFSTIDGKPAVTDRRVLR